MGHHSFGEAVLASDEEPPLAAHLVSPRGVYLHHGIYVGHGRVIHYAGLASGLRPGPVEEVPIEKLAGNHPIRLRPELARVDPHVVLRRARERLGENRYRLLTNNCKQFCEWCLCGRSRSAQVEWVSRLASSLLHLVGLAHSAMAPKASVHAPDIATGGASATRGQLADLAR